VEAAIGRFKQVIGDGLRSQTDTRQDTEVAVAVHVLNRMLAFGRSPSVRELCLNLGDGVIRRRSVLACW
jgi:hypothetical protein